MTDRIRKFDVVVQLETIDGANPVDIQIASEVVNLIQSAFQGNSNVVVKETSVDRVLVRQAYE